MMNIMWQAPKKNPLPKHSQTSGGCFSIRSFGERGVSTIHPSRSVHASQTSILGSNRSAPNPAEIESFVSDFQRDSSSAGALIDDLMSRPSSAKMGSSLVGRRPIRRFQWLREGQAAINGLSKLQSMPLMKTCPTINSSSNS